VDVLRCDVQDNTVQLTVTSPPYDAIRTYNGFEWDFQALTRELLRVTKPGGVVVWVVKDQTVKGNESGTSLRQALGFQEAGFCLHDTMIWEKDGFQFPDTNRYRDVFEYMFVFSKGPLKSVGVNLIADRPNKWAGTKRHGTDRQKDGTIRPKNHNEGVYPEFGVRYNVWHIPCEKKNKTGHPAVFPEAIARDHILSWSNPGDTVLDPFLGSGTTGKMAVLNGRHFIGIDISPEYVALANERIGKVSVENFV
jgi:site-specific DNA-methyltransferase (adenine-specific)